MLVVVIPLCPRLILVALVLPRLRAAAASTVRAPLLVVKLEAALPVREIAPPETVSPALPVKRLLKVLAPAKLWTPVVTIPGFVASAGPKVIVVPEIVAPLTCELLEKVPTVLTPAALVEATPPVTRHSEALAS